MQRNGRASGALPRSLMYLFAAWLIAAAQHAGAQPAAAADIQIPLRRLVLRDSEGQRIVLPPAGVTVVCFLGTECPLARLYGPRLAAMADEFGEAGVVFLAINSNLQDSPGDISDYVREHQIPFPVVKDADQKLADAFGATRTPEVFVLDDGEQIRYRGRVDDQYQPGKARPEPTQHDLRQAIADLLAGRSVALPRTDAVGCVITRVERAQEQVPEAQRVTFTRDIAPILNRRCVECHREGNIGPFALTDYDEVVGWGQMILEVIDQGRMPPWHADPAVGAFEGAREMPEAERETLAAWLDQGMPEGDPSLLPEPPQWAEGWHLATPPDVEIEMRERPLVIPAEGTLEYQYFVVDPHWETDRWVSAAQVIPGNSAVVHHTIVFVRPPDGSEFRGVGWVGGYVPGQRAVALPPGHARRVPAGSKLVFQMHYTPNGRETEDLSKLGVWFADPADVTHEVFTEVAIDQSFEIPPGEPDHEVAMRLSSYPAGSRLLSVMPHMHLRGKSFRLDVRRAGHRETVLSVPRYDFNWQHRYRFAEPLPLDEVDALEMMVRFDNSRGNPVNPDASEYVTWGDQTFEEMAVAFFDIARPRRPAAGSRSALQTAAEHSAEEGAESIADAAVRSDANTVADPPAPSAAAERAADEFLTRMDADGDGFVQPEETPVSFRSFAYHRFDRDRNGRLDRAEILKAAAERL